PWLGQACCPTGNAADCTNTSTAGMTGTYCQMGTSTCTSGARACQGGQSKTVESCNGVDDDCDGLIDDVPGAGQSCSDASVNTTGRCTARYACQPTQGSGPGGLTCMQAVGPTV